MSPHCVLSKYSIATIRQFDGAKRLVRFVQDANGTAVRSGYADETGKGFVRELGWPEEREKQK